jgi:hypothetical protein
VQQSNLKGQDECRRRRVGSYILTRRIRNVKNVMMGDVGAQRRGREHLPAGTGRAHVCKCVDGRRYTFHFS